MKSSVVTCGSSGLVLTVVLCTGVLASPGSSGDQELTYSRDVAPLLQENCETCHRAGQMAPMPLESYQQVRPWARSIARQVAARTMPPYGAHPESRDMLGSLYLSDAEVETIVDWARNGAPEGDPAELPEPKEFETYEGGWKLGNPDVVMQIAETFNVPADSGDRHQCFGLDFSAPVDLWLKGIEFLPDNTDVVHHFILFEDTQGNFEVADATSPDEPGVECPSIRKTIPGVQQLEAWAPGGTKALAPRNMARKFDADTKLVLQIHYSNQTGEVQPDRSSVAIHVAKPDEKITKAFRKGYVMGGRLYIKAGDAESRHEGRSQISQDITVYSSNAHMHKRGKSMRLSAILPGSPAEETILWVPDFDFDWQWNYEFAEPMKVPAGTELIVRSVHDNSASNPNNPDPTIDVTWGDASDDEMMFNIYTYSVDDEVLDVTPNALDPSWLEASKTASRGATGD